MPNSDLLNDYHSSLPAFFLSPDSRRYPNLARANVLSIMLALARYDRFNLGSFSKVPSKS